MRLEIGAPVSCSGKTASLQSILIKSANHVVTHLVVQAGRRPDAARIVPISLVIPVGDAISLTCSWNDFEQLDPTEQKRDVQAGDRNFQFRPGDTLTGMRYIPTDPTAPYAVSTSNVPENSYAFQSQSICAEDGHVGNFGGLIVDPSSREATHVLMAKKHLFGKKEIPIPITQVKRLGDGEIDLALTKNEVDAIASTSFA